MREYYEYRGRLPNGGTLSHIKPYIGLFHNYWRFHAPIDEITSKGSSCSLLRQEQDLRIHMRPLVDAGGFYA